MSGFAADHPGAEVRASPNFGPRRTAADLRQVPDMIVLHYTGMESGPAAENWLCNPASQVSSHYLVHEDGRVVQMVREQDRAWHAGAGSWRGETDVNSRSVGIEIVNGGSDFGSPAFPRKQIAAVIELCRGIIARHGIRPERVLGHSDTAPGRKVDPGAKFPWRRLARAGVGSFVEPSRARAGKPLSAGDSGREVEALQALLALHGYGVEVNGLFDDRTKTVVAAFQLHFRPASVDGVADAATVATLRRLLAASGRSRT